MWEIIYRTGEDDFVNKSVAITDEQYKQVQEVLRNGSDMIIIENKPTIKRTSIASINRLDETSAAIISKEYKQINERKLQALTGHVATAEEINKISAEQQDKLWEKKMETIRKMKENWSKKLSTF